MNGNNSSSCIELRNYNGTLIIRNCITFISSAFENSAEIKLINVNNSYIIDNNCSYNNGNGIYLLDCEGNTISSNTANNNLMNGIFLNNCIDNTIWYNQESFNENGLCGILLHYSDGNTISWNIIRNNNYGIYLNHSSLNYGIGNDLLGNNIPIFESADCVGNNFEVSTNSFEGPGHDNFLFFFIVLMVIIGIISAVVSGVIFFMRKNKSIKQELHSRKISNKEIFSRGPSKSSLISAQIPKLKKKIDSLHEEDIKKELSLEEKDELKRTESEINVRRESFICVVHKGPIVGTVYICPQCQTLYCQECVKALKKNEEGCWSCDRKFD